MNGRKIFAPAVLVSAGITGAYSEEESSMSGTTLKGLGITPGVSYKKAGENNPLYTQRFGADPGVMEYNGRLYVYTTDDIVERNSAGQVAENTYGKIKTINCISSDDLVNWTDHGRIPVAGSSGIAKWAQNSWAPCAAHKTIDGKEKFFLYFCNGGNGIGVLAADDPAGPWRDELGHLLITRSTPNCANVTWLFDPAVMVDDCRSDRFRDRRRGTRILRYRRHRESFYRRYDGSESCGYSDQSQRRRGVRCSEGSCKTRRPACRIFFRSCFGRGEKTDRYRSPRNHCHGVSGSLRPLSVRRNL